MKKLLLMALLSLATLSAMGQRYGYHKNYDKPMTVQVVPTILGFEGVKYGLAIGTNIKQVFALNFFFVRDYDYGNNFTDGFYTGFHLNAVLPVSEFFELGGGIRTGKLMTSGNLYAQKQGPIFTGEMRLKLSDGFRIAFEYGKSKQVDSETGSKTKGRSISSLRFLFNLY